MGPEDDFFVLGGDSITAVRVICRAYEDGLRVRDLKELPTREAAARHRSRTGPAAAASSPLLDPQVAQQVAARYSISRDAVSPPRYSPDIRWTS